MTYKKQFINTYSLNKICIQTIIQMIWRVSVSDSINPNRNFDQGERSKIFNNIELIKSKTRKLIIHTDT